ncbi:AMP-binding protein [Nocardia shimofusensis]|uniref:AMP-binding protein n=1 Tax=Nocardia shimofusensis TaxID=228596 RepID=UPI0008326C51|nr:AMP-binding protein [Nocardia shimofusensis]
MRVIPNELRDRYEREGWWRRETLGELLAGRLAENGDLAFHVHSAARPWVGTFAEVELSARRLAAGLRERGVGPGDVIAFRLPNWREAAVTFWASAFLGAVVVPVVHFYGPKELAHILGAARPKVFVTTEGLSPELCAQVPIVGTVDGADANFEELSADPPMAGVLPADPAAPALIAFTSGTTSAPKGVVHSHQTLGCEVRQLAEQNALDDAVQLTATPVGHFIGMVGAFLIPVLHGKAVHLMDGWEPGRALALMREHGLAVGGGPPYFVTGLLEHADFTPDHLASVKYVGLGGSAVSVSVTRRLADLGLVPFRAYGSTEHPSITASRYTAPEFERLCTDGRPMPGVEIRLAEDGEILSRGPDLCLGYLDDEQNAKVFDGQGWYRTGDIGVLHEDGHLTVTDRKSDVIIRGGENIGALEVEEVLTLLPAVAEAVVVAVPDARFGEIVGAVLRLRPGARMPTRGEVREHFAATGVARQKWPERLFRAADFPRTAGGKVRKHLIRRAIAAQPLRHPNLENIILQTGE